MYILGQIQGYVDQVKGMELQLFSWALHKKSCSEGCGRGIGAGFGFLGLGNPLTI